MTAGADFDADAFWRFCLQVLKTELPVQQINTWIEPLSVAYNEVEGLCILAPNRFILQWIKTRYLPRIDQLAQEYCIEPIKILLKLSNTARGLGRTGFPRPTAQVATPVAKTRVMAPIPPESRAVLPPIALPPHHDTGTNLIAESKTQEASIRTEDKPTPPLVDDPRRTSAPITRTPPPPAIMAWTPSHTTGHAANPADEFFAVPSATTTSPAPTEDNRIPEDRPYLIHDTDHLNIYDGHDDIDTLYERTHLNPVLTFTALVRGRANDLAHAAARQVADSPGQTYNPLFIYGGVGLGKTHILQAVGNATFQQNPSLIIRYIHANDYYSDVVKAYQQGSFEHFANYYRSLDILLIDDIQFFNNKTRTQEEFFHAFNALIEAKKQVIITCDTYPKEIAGLSDRLISRFDWGLTVALEPPEPEMRVAILKKKAEIEGINLDEGVAFFIAKHLRSNVRELEGALNKVLAYARFHGRDIISIDITRRALEDLLSAHNRQITVELIQKTVADYYKIKVSDLFSKRRTINITRPRQIAMALARELTTLSLPTIGEAFGGRDHTTVLHACRHIAKLRIKDQQMNHDMHVLSQTLKG